MESEIIKFFYKLSTNELPKSVCSKFNLVHEIHTRNTRNNLLIYIPRITTSRYGNHSLRSDGASLWNKFFKDFFLNHDLTSFLKLKSFLTKRFLQTYENELSTFDTRSNNFLSIFSLERSFMKCGPATQSSNLMIEINEVRCMDIGVYVFYMCLYVYIHICFLCRYVLFASVCACSYLHIFTYSFV